eukprot:1964736-Amphidinium_carterae.1
MLQRKRKLTEGPHHVLLPENTSHAKRCEFLTGVVVSGLRGLSSIHAQHSSGNKIVIWHAKLHGRMRFLSLFLPLGIGYSVVTQAQPRLSPLFDSYNLASVIIR